MAGITWWTQPRRGALADMLGETNVTRSDRLLDGRTHDELPWQANSTAGTAP